MCATAFLKTKQGIHLMRTKFHSRTTRSNSKKGAGVLDTTEELIESINRQIIHLYSKGQYEQALSIALEIYERASQELDNHNLIYATYLNNLARLYYTLGEYEQAVPLYRQVIGIRRAVLGEHHPEYANSLNNLAAVYQATGKYNQAEQLYRQVADVLRSTPDQGSLYAISLNNLAELYHTTGRYNEAKHYTARPVISYVRNWASSISVTPPI
jgi:tetratricopeptide (TPR) repeat protein